MKKLFIGLAIAITFVGVAYSAEPETKRVCVDKITPDGKPVMGKDGKPQQECKEIKVHKKLEGTKVPDKK